MDWFRRSDVSDQQHVSDNRTRKVTASSRSSMPVHKALNHHWNPVAIVFLIFNLVSTGLYFYLRIKKIMEGEYSVFWYAVFVLAVEALGVTSLVPYALLVTRAVLPNNGEGGGPLPTTGDPVFNFRVHVLVPCYKEDISVIEATIDAALDADIPAGTKRIVYLCDDGGDDQKRLYCARRGVEYVSGRDKSENANGKSCNLNNCLQNVIFPHLTTQRKDNPRLRTIEKQQFDKIDHEEILVVFDADMVCKKCFFTELLAVMTDPEYALCLSPQGFTNINAARDLYNNINLQFWEYWLPGAVGWGYIACTGTNFAIRIRALCQAGWFPTYTITEDYALGYELKKLGYKGTYLLKYLAEGEAPDEIRNVFRQRSRWTKGHMQVFFSWKYCPLLQWNLGFDQKLWYSYGTWTYFCSIFTVPTFIIVPFVSLALGVHPTMVDLPLALVATAYFASCFAVQSYVRDFRHWMSLWFMGVSNVVLWFTYLKAVINTWLSIAGLKTLGFKATVKKVVAGAAPAAGAAPTAPAATSVAGIISSLSRRMSRKGAPPEETQNLGPDNSTPDVPINPTTTTDTGEESEYLEYGWRTGSATESASVRKSSRRSVRFKQDVPAAIPEEKVALVSDPAFTAAAGGAVVVAAELPKEDKPEVSWGERIWNVFVPGNIGDLGGVLDPLALVCLFFFSVSSIGMGIFRVVSGSISTDGSSYFMNTWVALPMLWACLTAIPPYLFIHYCFTGGPSFEKACNFTRTMSRLLTFAALVLVFVTLPRTFDMRQALSMSVDFIDNQRASNLKVPEVALDLGETGWYVLGNGNRPMMPTAYATMYLAWGLNTSSSGFGSKADTVYTNIKAGADFIERSFRADGTFVVQVGDPRRYATEGDPAGQGRAATDADDPDAPQSPERVWTRLRDDLTPETAATRPVYTISKANMGHDVLGSATAALAAAAAAAQLRNLDDYTRWVAAAEKMWELATANTQGRERSYCKAASMQLDGTSAKEKERDADAVDTVCEFRLSTSTSVMAEEVSDAVPAVARVKCWVADFSSKTCTPRDSQEACFAARKWANVYKRRHECCAEMSASGMYANQTTAQGSCALPEGQLHCFIPHPQSRSCQAEAINITSGKGCTGVGLHIYPTSRGCCHSLHTYGAVSAEQPATGLCAQDFGQLIKMDSCWVPDLTQGTCRNVTGGRACGSFGIGGAFIDAFRCCNRMVALRPNQELQGVCRGNGTVQPVQPAAPTMMFTLPGVVPAAQPSPAPKRLRRRLLQQDGLDALKEHLPADAQGLLQMLEDQLRGAAGGGTRNGAASPSPSPKPAPAASPAPSAPANKTSADADALAQALATIAVPFDYNISAFEEDATPRDSLQGTEYTTLVRSETIVVSNFPSDSVLDDMALAAAWLYKATGKSKYLGQARYYMSQHQIREMNKGLAAKRQYYIPNYDHNVWAAAVLLADITDHPHYHDIARTFLRAWQGYSAPPVSSRQEKLAQLVRQQRAANAELLLRRQHEQQLITVPEQTADGTVMKTYRVIEPVCIPERNATARPEDKIAPTNSTFLLASEENNAKQWEDVCDDGIDNDCDGLTDDDDPECPWSPIKYTPKGLSWSEGEPLPAAAAAAFLTMAYVKAAPHRLTTAQKANMRCWALGQVYYMLGSARKSYVVGFGDDPPDQVQHAQSSCSPKEVDGKLEACDWDSGFYASVPNPDLDMVKGALVAGPDLRDGYVNDRASDQARVGVHYNAPFASVLAALLQEGMTSRTCGSLKGVYQDLFAKPEL